MGARRRVAAVALAALAAAGCTDGGPAPSTPSAAPGGWQRLAAAPGARTEVVAAVLGTRVYVIGGYTSDGATVGTVEVLDTATGRWERGPDLPVPVNHAMAATVGGAVHVFGGYLADRRPSAGVFRLDGSTWRAVADLPEPRAAGTAVAVGDTAYVAGGLGPGGLAARMLVYDARSDAWTTAPGPPTAREHLGGAAYAGKVYTVGGRVGGLRGNRDALEVFDPASGAWQALPPMPTARGGLSAAAACGVVVAVGGEAQATFPQVEAYDVGSGTWRALPASPTPRHGLGVASVGSRLFVLAGGPQPGLHVSDAAEALDLATLGPCPTPS
jgi:non-specific serine/threonine protein kinase